MEWGVYYAGEERRGQMRACEDGYLVTQRSISWVEGTRPLEGEAKFFEGVWFIGTFRFPLLRSCWGRVLVHSRRERSEVEEQGLRRIELDAVLSLRFLLSYNNNHRTLIMNGYLNNKSTTRLNNALHPRKAIRFLPP